MKKLVSIVVLGLFGLGAGNVVADDATSRLDTVLAAQPEHMKARYEFRNPGETLMFFGVKPGMKVADFLPGKDWYASILLPYLGEEGTYAGADLSMTTWADYGRSRDDTEAFLESQKAWVDRFKENAEGWRKPEDAQVNAFRVDEVPESLVSQFDVIMAVRALHLPTRVDGEVKALAAGIFKALKPGGVFGVVQHRAPESASDEWAKGHNGYVKQSALIREIEAAGFVLEASSEINANPKDQPKKGDQVWRLPPTSKDGSHDDIGESDRMTLRFRKPA